MPKPEAQESGCVQPEDFCLVSLRQPSVKTDRVGFGHIERIVRPHAKLVGTMRLNQTIELTLIEYQRVEPDFP